MDFITQILNGLGIGSIYALIALGYSMVYGIVQLINFAHGDIIMVGAYIVYVILVMLGMPLWGAIIGSLIFCAFAGVFIERVAYRRLLVHGAPRISLLITAIGVSIFLQNLFQVIFGSEAKSMPRMFDVEPVMLGSLQISSSTILNILTSVVMMVGLQLLVGKTKIGKAMRATSEDAGAAKLMGINTNHTIAFTFAVGSALAAVGAVLMLLADIARAINIIKRTCFNMPHFMGYAGFFLRRVRQFFFIYGNPPLREGHRNYVFHWELINNNAVFLSKLIKG